MRLFQLFGGRALAVALGLAMVPASIAVPQSVPIAGPVVGVAEAQAQYYRGGRGFYHGGRHWRGDRGFYRHHRRSNRNAAIGGAVAGLALGAIIAGAASQPRYVERRYIDRRYVPVQPRGHHVGYRPAPWSAEWYRYCSQRYRSFDPRSGTFQPYRGPRQLCR